MHVISQRWYRFIQASFIKCAGEEINCLWETSLYDDKNDNVANSILWSTNKSASFADAAVSNV